VTHAPGVDQGIDERQTTPPVSAGFAGLHLWTSAAEVRHRNLRFIGIEGKREFDGFPTVHHCVGDEFAGDQQEIIGEFATRVSTEPVRQTCSHEHPRHGGSTLLPRQGEGRSVQRLNTPLDRGSLVAFYPAFEV
jgi:hypothetical protein